MLQATNGCDESIVVVTIGRVAAEVDVTAELFSSVMITETKQESSNRGTAGARTEP